eukprot:g66148.t1
MLHVDWGLRDLKCPCSPRHVARSDHRSSVQYEGRDVQVNLGPTFFPSSAGRAMCAPGILMKNLGTVAGARAILWVEHRAARRVKDAGHLEFEFPIIFKLCKHQLDEMSHCQIRT